jgi:hypothetical protein
MLEENLADQEAFYSRGQAVIFIRDKRYATDLRNLACAIADLPYMTCE